MVPFLILALSSLAWSLPFDWQGHRGARGLYPENTINAMKEAMKYPITTLELDVVMSKDNMVVVSHEPWMNEEMCLDPNGKEVKGMEVNLYKLNYDEIKKYDCGSKVHPRFKEQAKVKESKPLLSDLLTEMEKEMKLKGTLKKYNIEIKSTPEEEKNGYQPEFQKFTDEVMKVITGIIPGDRFTIQSFDWRVLKYIHEKYPDIQLVALRETPYTPEDVLKELGFAPRVFSPDYNLLKDKEIEYFHLKGTLVIPWTVNNVKDMKNLILMGVDGIITDYPNLIQETLPKCKKKETIFEGKCVRVPTHAIPSDKHPGWDCKPGFVQKRARCEKLKLPEHSILNEDGKSWSCAQGYERYRAICRKK